MIEIQEDDLVWSKQLNQIVKVGWRKPDKVFIWFIPSGTGGCWLPYEDLEIKGEKMSSVPGWFVEETGLDDEFIWIDSAYNDYLSSEQDFSEWWADHQGDFV